MNGSPDPDVAAAAEEQSFEGQERIVGTLARTQPKHDEPQGRNRVQHPETAREAEAVEVVRNHEDGTRSGFARPVGREGDGNIDRAPSGLSGRTRRRGEL